MMMMMMLLYTYMCIYLYGGGAGGFACVVVPIVLFLLLLLCWCSSSAQLRSFFLIVVGCVARLVFFFPRMYAHSFMQRARCGGVRLPLLFPFFSIQPSDTQRRVAYISFFPYSLLYLLHLRNGCQTGGAPSSSSSSSLTPFLFSHTAKARI